MCISLSSLDKRERPPPVPGGCGNARHVYCNDRRNFNLQTSCTLELQPNFNRYKPVTNPLQRHVLLFQRTSSCPSSQNQQIQLRGYPTELWTSLSRFVRLTFSTRTLGDVCFAHFSVAILLLIIISLFASFCILFDSVKRTWISCAFFSFEAKPPVIPLDHRIRYQPIASFFL